MTNKIAIIGAGIAGTTTAYSLAKQGMDVTLIDSRRYPAMATSYANGGQLSASNSEVWNTPKNIINGMKWMFKKDAPLLFNPSTMAVNLSLSLNLNSPSPSMIVSPLAQAAAIARIGYSSIKAGEILLLIVIFLSFEDFTNILHISLLV